MKIITKYSSYILAFLLLSIFTQSCREEPLEVTPIPRDKVMSFSDLFDSFWDEMNNNYNYFFEEDYDWDDVYEIYSPKFKKLRTFKDIDADPNVAEREIQLAFKYFADIISKIKDRHFYVSITIPFYANKGGIDYNRFRINTLTFSGGMKYRYSVEDGFELIKDDSANPKVNSYTVRKLMEEKLMPNTVFKKVVRLINGPYVFLSGFLKSDPSIMYINFNNFVNSAFFDPLRKFPLLRVVEKDKMKEDAFDKFFKVDRVNAQYFKEKMETSIDNLYNGIASVLESDEYKEYLDARAHFFQTEDISKLDAIKDEFDRFSSEPMQRYIEESKAIYREISAYHQANKKNNSYKLMAVVYDALNEYDSVCKNLFKLSHFIGYNQGKRVSIGALVKRSCNEYGEVYKKLLNLITKGEVKKLIIDLRGNGGGLISDTNFFVSRFISKKSNAGYYRTKQGNGRFNYGPWLPFEIEPNKFSTPEAIQTVILLDRGSASMSEITSMILKGQGDNNVKIIGDNSAGATAALKDQDDFNGGSFVQGAYFNFNMPMMAYKTLDGKTIEGDGITPDIKVIPTKEEVKNMKTNKYDPVFNRALEEIRKMTVN